MNNRDLTQLQLSRETGISQVTINTIMQGKSGMNLYTAVQLCEALDISLDNLVGLKIKRRITSTSLFIDAVEDIRNIVENIPDE